MTEIVLFQLFYQKKKDSKFLIKSERKPPVSYFPVIVVLSHRVLLEGNNTHIFLFHTMLVFKKGKYK